MRKIGWTDRHTVVRIGPERRSLAARMGAAGEDAYLETDKPANVRLCERLGFEVVGEAEVLSVPDRFMVRRSGR